MWLLLVGEILFYCGPGLWPVKSIPAKQSEEVKLFSRLIFHRKCRAPRLCTSMYFILRGDISSWALTRTNRSFPFLHRLVDKGIGFRGLRELQPASRAGA